MKKYFALFMTTLIMVSCSQDASISNSVYLYHFEHFSADHLDELHHIEKRLLTIDHDQSDETIVLSYEPPEGKLSVEEKGLSVNEYNGQDYEELFTFHERKTIDFGGKEKTLMVYHKVGYSLDDGILLYTDEDDNCLFLYIKSWKSIIFFERVLHDKIPMDEYRLALKAL